MHTYKLNPKNYLHQEQTLSDVYKNKLKDIHLQPLLVAIIHQKLIIQAAKKFSKPIYASGTYQPLPDDQDNIVVQFYPVKGERPTPVRLRLKSGPTASHRHNVQISVPWPTGEAKLTKKAERSKVLDIAARCMVSILKGSVDGELILSRHQLLDTMDKDELSYHVELVALASRELAAEFGA